ncbi:hypothetical protein BN405_2-10_Ab1_orf_103 [Pseudomonas phage vB_PaeM_C2-10_Ab1]|uniref:Uncharacterized protein n=6 Tax=Pakpunavirus TaxID=1921407 RepID=K4RI37_9CAUD|nr:hypothetical protein BN405_2-10_Ab1_orf_103 [Pseudomonas phage vB_PaeM_C2-10_Ab1]YP_008859271.1 hypothetical protein PAK_P400060 [Pseudomonas phage PAK_P4]YP_010763100.1 hypothetical protein QE328_gp112 [Pseudomonas phage vB_PaM_EPA1]YP_010763187.1 hypothetical protein QE329_gp027 [Pseudomonas phage PhL_UNISO_PA-DSM_ph0034]YP_010765174.1 hypothetical protein QE347_gp066 [Pseudomonas phage vB_Paer_Ps12]UOL47710.1 hypothetical protein vBPaerPs25_66 [Pseudomonas phage vB_Paer_Ps25]CEF89423.1 
MQINFGPIFLLAAIVLCVLKSAGVLAISWTVALMPIWIPLVIVLSVLLLLLVVAGLIYAFGDRSQLNFAFKKNYSLKKNFRNK